MKNTYLHYKNSFSLIAFLFIFSSYLSNPAIFNKITALQEINVKGNNSTITNGSITINSNNNTNFGNVTNCNGISKTFTIQNIGTSNLTLTENITITGSVDFFLTTSPSNSIITANTSQNFVITYIPNQTGIQTAIVSIPNDDADENPYTFTIQAQSSGTSIPTAQSQKLVPSTPISDGRFGRSVYMDKNYAIVGAYKEASGGSAYIYKLNGTQWIEEAKIKGNDTNSGDGFGFSVMIEGDYVVVGALYAGSSNQGAAYIFKRNGTTWTQQKRIEASDSQEDSEYGVCVSISGEHVVVGAQRHDSQGSESGSAYVYKRSGTSWTLQQKIIGNDTRAGNRFGHSVSISGENIVVGAILEGIGGSAYIFKKSGANWTQQQKITSNDIQSGDYFGRPVFISGDYIIAGADEEDTGATDAGAAYIFKRNGTTWTQEAKLQALDRDAYDRFGNSVKINGDIAVMGAYLEGVGGSVYTFKKNGANWVQQTKITADDIEAIDNLGYGCSMSGKNLIVGAFSDDRNGMIDAGAAYIFTPRQISVKGNNTIITNNSTTPSTTNNTDFGEVINTKTVTYTIQNKGVTNLLISSIAINGINAPDFAISNFRPNTTITAGQSTTFDATFNTTLAGIKTAIITISSNDCDSNYDFAIQAKKTGVVPPTDANLKLNATAISSTQINLNWTTNAQATYYLLYRDEVLIAQITATTTTYNDENLTPDTFYQYKLIALINDINSLPSSDNEWTLPKKPTLISVSSVCGNRSVNRKRAVIKLTSTGSIYRVYDESTNGTLLLESNNGNFELPFTNQNTVFYISVVANSGKESERIAVNVEVQTSFEAVILGAIRQSSCTNYLLLKAQLIENANSYIWLLNGEQINEGSQLIATSSGNYTLKITKGDCSYLSDNVEVLLNQTPLAQIKENNISKNVSFCKNGTLNAIQNSQNATLNSSYKWKLNNNILGQSPTLEVSESGIYLLFVNAQNCTDTTSIQVIIIEQLQIPILKATKDSICKDTETTIFAENTESGISYQWTRNGQILAQNTSSITTKDIGQYQVKAISQNQCTAISATLLIAYFDDFLATLKENKEKKSIFVEAANFENLTNQIIDVKWYFEGELKTELGTNLEIIPTKEGNYSAKVTNQNGCIFSTSNINYMISKTPEIPKEEDKENDDFKIYPNPNNGIFIIAFKTALIENIQITIFDAIGRKIHTQILEKENQEFVIDLKTTKNVSNGIYLIRFERNNKKYSEQIIVE